MKVEKFYVDAGMKSKLLYAYRFEHCVSIKIFGSAISSHIFLVSRCLFTTGSTWKTPTFDESADVDFMLYL